MDNVEEDLTCSVCYSLFADPRVLPCSHTFCKSCLDNLLQASNNYSIWRPLRLPLKCPNCRSVVELPPAGVDALPSNVSLRAIVEKYQSDSEPRPPACPEHLRQPLNMYCIQDRQLICGLCLTVGEHQGHPIDDLQAAFIREKRTPSLLLARLSDRTWAQVCDLGEQLEQEKARCEALLRQDRQEVLQFFSTLEALLEEQLDLVSLGSAVEEEDSPLVFLEKVHQFRERVEGFMKTPLPSVINLSVTPRAAEYLQQHWSAVTMGALEEAPVPKVCCCTRCGGGGGRESSEQHGEGGEQQQQSRRRRRRESQQHSAPAALLGLLLPLLLLLGAALWLNPVGGASLGFSLMSQLSQALHGLSSELLASTWDAAGWLYAQMDSCRSQVSSARDKLSQQLADWFQL